MSTTTLGAHRLRWAVTDTLVLTGRALAHWTRQPGQLIAGLLFPVLLVLMFGYLFGGAMSVPGGGDYREFLLPGMFVMTMAFGIEASYAAVATDTARGVTDRFRSLPMARSAVVGGRAVADLLHSAAGLVVMLGCGWLVGWRWHNGLAPALVAVGLLLLLRVALIWAGIYLALLLRRPESIVALQILVWPVGFTSNAYVPPETMPGWLGAVAEWNPLSATVAACRELFGNPGWGGDSFAAQHALALAVAWPLLLVAVFLPLSVRRYRQLGR
ncbi:ABC transporter permease [Micromonospora globbae]|uniref:Transport permease protein n=1 Tax=Micromonospora globbae TaxID=1894969 RepID=A0ABZ1SDP2_9ACTN|nr:ABC transporter permease [Micromonospora globbae]